MSNVSKGQIQLPGEFRPGEPIRAGEMDKLRKAIAFAMKDMIGSGRGITVTQSAGKYLISARNQRSGAPKHPFQLEKGTDGSGDPALLVRKGTVNSIVPEIDTTELDTDYEENILPIPENGSRTYWLKITSTEGDLDDPASTKAAEIITTGTDPGDDTATQAKQELGSVTTDDSGAIESFSSNLSGSQNVDSCGASHSWNRI